MIFWKTNERNKLMNRKIISVILIFVIMNVIIPGYVKASGGEGMDYCLLLETNVGYEIDSNYFRYGIYGDFTTTVQEGEDIYFRLNEKMIESVFEPETQLEWADNRVNEHITDISPDLEWIVTRQFDDNSKYVEKLYQGSAQIDERNSSLSNDIRNYIIKSNLETGNYQVLSEDKTKELKGIIQELWGKTPGYYFNSLYSFDEYGELLAIAEKDNRSIRIYRTEDWKLLYKITMTEAGNWPLEISQIKGTEESGFIVFSIGDDTYRVTYPDKKAEKLGEFMFCTSYSPDMKYRAYCTGNSILFDCWELMDAEELPLYSEMRKKWDTIPPGWYIEDLETGNKTYIPIETWKWDVDRPLYGGRCIWIQKDKLFQVLDL